MFASWPSQPTVGMAVRKPGRSAFDAPQNGGKAEDGKDRERGARGGFLPQRDSRGNDGREHERAVAGVAHEHGEEEGEEGVEGDGDITLGVTGEDAKALEDHADGAEDTRRLEQDGDVGIVRVGLLGDDTPAFGLGFGKEVGLGASGNVATKVGNLAGITQVGGDFGSGTVGKRGGDFAA